MTVHTGTWTRDDRLAGPYRYLPVDVPPGSAALAVELDYDRSAGALDLGCFGPSGFRGWSGGARDRFVVGRRAATPGYLPGELEPGTWLVALGLHRIGPRSVSYRVTAAPLAAEPDPPPEQRPPLRPAPHRRNLPHEPGLRWLAGDLHAHTVHSDGALTVAELAAMAAARGLDFLAVTDHNTVSQHAECGPVSAWSGVTLLPGQEVTTGRGHANVFGEVGWIDFREPADRWLAESDRRGGMMSVNHPLAADCTWQYPMERRPPLAEVWHWTWLDRRWGGPLAWWTAQGGGTVPVGGSDWHRPGSDAPPGQPTTWLAAADTGPRALLEALRAGRTAVSAGPDAPVLLRVAGDLVAVGADGLAVAAPDGRLTRVRGERASLRAGPGPHVLVDDDGTVVALC